MSRAGSGDAGGLAVGLRRGVTGIGMRALAAKAVHVAAAAPERLSDVYDNAAAGWLAGPVFTPRARTEAPLPISAAFWDTSWALVNLPAPARDKVFAAKLLQLAGHLDPRINPHMAAAALEIPGVAEAAKNGIPPPHGLHDLGGLSPASLGYLVNQHTMNADSETGAFQRLLPWLRHMPAPLDYINIQVIQTLPVLSAVAGYSAAPLDQMALGGFLMAQVAHHYSALATAVTLTIVSLERPVGLELVLDCIFRGWTHGRETPQLIGVDWAPLLPLRIDQAREVLNVAPFTSAYPKLADYH